ncbi:MAG: pyridoxamine 5'-phosphate oxidase family protein [Patescibacteria group bacterium]
MDELVSRAKEIISKILYITVATVSDRDEPWNAPVFAAYDRDYNFYWGTYRNSQKSKNIRANPTAFLVIYDSTAPAGTGEGVYIKATALELEDLKEIKLAYDLLCVRHTAPFWKWEAVQSNAPIRLYKAVPEKVWMNSGEKKDGHYVDTRVEIKLI